MILEGPQPAGGNSTQRIFDDDELGRALSVRDARGGGYFCLSPEHRQYPLLILRMSGSVGDAHFIKDEGQPVFRCLGGEALPQNGFTLLIFDGCDPSDGEKTPNEFILTSAQAMEVARYFFRHSSMVTSRKWLELRA